MSQEGPIVAKSETTTELPKLRVTFHSREEVLDLVNDLRRALKRSESAGGCYWAFSKDRTGTVEFQIHVPARVRMRRARKC